jgi:hypothetical protein
LKVARQDDLELGHQGEGISYALELLNFDPCRSAVGIIFTARILQSEPDTNACFLNTKSKRVKISGVEEESFTSPRPSASHQSIPLSDCLIKSGVKPVPNPERSFKPCPSSGAVLSGLWSPVV